MSAYRETRVALADLRTAVVQACAGDEPLGAFATAERLNYLFAGGREVRCLTAPRPAPGVSVESVGSLYPAFAWHEREMGDTYGVVHADSSIDARLFIGPDGVVPQALAVEGKGVSVIVVGPVHAGIIEPGRFTFSSGGETVIHLDAQLSYSRRGVERFLEGRSAIEVAPQIARICAACSVARSWAYARALEDLAGLRCDERSEWARIVCAELERVYNHLFDLASSAAGAGYGYGQTRGLALKERAHEIAAAATGHRLLFDAIVPGGVRDGVLARPADLRPQIAALRDDTVSFAAELFANGSVASRFEATGYVAPETARAFGGVGPARRASGGDVDIRRLLPYGAYAGETVDAHVDTGGDAAARCRIKHAELSESFGLIDRALAALGEHAPPAPRPVAPAAGTITTATEGPRGCESISVDIDASGLLRRVHVISSSYRNWPLVVRAMEGNIVPDFPLVNKSFNLCYACADR